MSYTLSSKQQETATQHTTHSRIIKALVYFLRLVFLLRVDIVPQVYIDIKAAPVTNNSI